MCPDVVIAADCVYDIELNGFLARALHLMMLPAERLGRCGYGSDVEEGAATAAEGAASAGSARRRLPRTAILVCAERTESTLADFCGRFDASVWRLTDITARARATMGPAHFCYGGLLGDSGRDRDIMRFLELTPREPPLPVGAAAAAAAAPSCGGQQWCDGEKLERAWIEMVSAFGGSSWLSTVRKWLSDPAFHRADGKSRLATTKDPCGITLLHYAAAGGDEAAVKLLLTHGADPHARNSLGDTPADDARAFEHPELVSLLGHDGAASVFFAVGCS